MRRWRLSAVVAPGRVRGGVERRAVRRLERRKRRRVGMVDRGKMRWGMGRMALESTSTSTFVGKVLKNGLGNPGKENFPRFN